jgi:hypothetical protein
MQWIQGCYLETPVSGCGPRCWRLVFACAAEAALAEHFWHLFCFCSAFVTVDGGTATATVRIAAKLETQFPGGEYYSLIAEPDASSNLASALPSVIYICFDVDVPRALGCQLYYVYTSKANV